MDSYLIKGIIIGFSIAAPVGPIGILCIKKSLTENRLSGLLTGLGAATADAIYGIIAATGLTIVSQILITYKEILGLLGGLFLLYLGVKTFRSNPPKLASSELPVNQISNFFTTLVLTLTNPMTILSFIGIFAALSTNDNNQKIDVFSSVLMVVGVFVGSALWWVILSFFASAIKNKLTSGGLKFINKLSGITIILFSIYALLQALEV